MPSRPASVDFYLPRVGCALAFFLLLSMCILPWIFIEAMQSALTKLHLGPLAITLATLGILLGGAINIPLYRVERDNEPVHLPLPWSAMQGWAPWMPRGRFQTIVAMNVGGCVIPSLLALHELQYVLSAPRPSQTALLLAVSVNIAICWWLARPIAGVGIALPFFVSPAAAIGMAWLLLGGAEFAEVRAPVAFIAGICGPLIGADLLNLKRFEQAAIGIISIGGAGTFDGIVLSGIVAALLV